MQRGWRGWDPEAREVNRIMWGKVGVGVYEVLRERRGGARTCAHTRARKCSGGIRIDELQRRISKHVSFYFVGRFVLVYWSNVVARRATALPGRNTLPGLVFDETIGSIDRDDFVGQRIYQVHSLEAFSCFVFTARVYPEPSTPAGFLHARTCLCMPLLCEPQRSKSVGNRLY